jgi:hypothetical protein
MLQITTIQDSALCKRSKTVEKRSAAQARSGRKERRQSGGEEKRRTSKERQRGKAAVLERKVGRSENTT